jgi:hypothetical protein
MHLLQHTVSYINADWLCRLYGWVVDSVIMCCFQLESLYS